MPGPISTNAPFTQWGHDTILRDIEQLYLLVDQTTGDLGNQPIESGDMSGAGAGNNDQSGGGSRVHYLGTLDLPIFGGQSSVAGDAAGLYAVDWQQSRVASTQVASGAGSVILGGINNTASGAYAIAGGFQNIASGAGAVSIGSQLEVSGARSFGFFGNTANNTATDSAFFHPLFAVDGSNNYAFAGYGLPPLASHVFAWENGRLTPQATIIKGSLTNTMLLGGRSYAVQSNAGNTGVISNGLFFESRFTSTTATSGGLTNFALFNSAVTNQGNFGIDSLYLFNSTVSHGGTVGNSSHIFAVNCTGVVVDGASDFVAFNLPPTTPISGSIYLGTSFFYPTWAATTKGVAISGIMGNDGAFGCNNATPRTSAALAAAIAAAPGAYSAVYEQTIATLLNQIRTALINNGICA